MNPILNRNNYFVKEHTGIFKAANNYDVFDLESKESLIECREPNLGFFTKMFRFTKYKPMTPFDVILSQTGTGVRIMSVKRPVTFFRSVVSVHDENDVQVGTLRKVFKLLKPCFEILDANNNKIGTLEGNFVGWEFSVKDNDGNALATVTKKWAGIGKELFTTADNYACNFSDTVKENDPQRILLMAAVICVDMVLKER
ncbi:MAG: phospholipid scramblase-related protein [Bacteroidota bacterium]